MLQNHLGCSLKWLCNILKVSTNSVEPGVRAITDLDYGWLVFSLNKTCMSIDIHISIYFALVNNVEPVFQVINKLDYG